MPHKPTGPLRADELLWRAYAHLAAAFASLPATPCHLPPRTPDALARPAFAMQFVMVTQAMEAQARAGDPVAAHLTCARKDWLSAYHLTPRAGRRAPGLTECLWHLLDRCAQNLRDARAAR